MSGTPSTTLTYKAARYLLPLLGLILGAMLPAAAGAEVEENGNDEV